MPHLFLLPGTHYSDILHGKKKIVKFKHGLLSVLAPSGVSFHVVIFVVTGEMYVPDEQGLLYKYKDQGKTKGLGHTIQY